jgi:hypothetical protein
VTRCLKRRGPVITIILKWAPVVRRMSQGRLARARPKLGSWFTCQALKSTGVLLLGGSVGIIAPGANVTWLSLELILVGL